MGLALRGAIRGTASRREGRALDPGDNTEAKIGVLRRGKHVRNMTRVSDMEGDVREMLQSSDGKKGKAEARDRSNVCRRMCTLSGQSSLQYLERSTGSHRCSL